MVAVLVDTAIKAEIEIDTLIIGGGAAGLTAALAAFEAGNSVLIAERETILSGSTALSSGLIPAAGTAIQLEQSIHSYDKSLLCEESKSIEFLQSFIPSE